MYSIFLHPDRQGNGPSFWGYEETGQSCDIFWGKLEGPFQTRSMKSGYSTEKQSEKLGKGYRDVGSVPADQMPTFFNVVPKTRSQHEWESLPIGTMESRLVNVLRTVRTVCGLSSVHPDDSRPPEKPPPHRRPIRTKIKAKKLAWMF